VIVAYLPLLLPLCHWEDPVDLDYHPSLWSYLKHFKTLLHFPAKAHWKSRLLVVWLGSFSNIWDTPSVPRCIIMAVVLHFHISCTLLQSRRATWIGCFYFNLDNSASYTNTAAAVFYIVPNSEE